MDWNNFRGSAINIPVKTKLDLRLLEFKLNKLIMDELDEYLDNINLKNNKFGKWIII